MQQITIAGRLGKDSERKSAQNGDSFLSFSVAVDSKDRGEKVTTWYSCMIWGKRGDALAQYLTKGTSVTVAGELRAKTFQGRDGSTKLDLSIRVSEIALQGGREKPAERGGGDHRGNDDYGGSYGSSEDPDIPFSPRGRRREW